MDLERYLHEINQHIKPTLWQRFKRYLPELLMRMGLFALLLIASYITYTF